MSCKKICLVVVGIIVILLGTIKIAYSSNQDMVEHSNRQEIPYTFNEPQVQYYPIACCYVCGTILTEESKIPMLEKNVVCISGTDINHSFSVSSFTQKAVDKYDIVYSEEALGKDDPFILGHQYRDLGMLYQTKVGSYIYINIEGVIEIYEVIVSEYGIQNSNKTDIIGQTTGASIWDNYDCKTLHLYTCYGSNKDGRWMVLAKQVF